MKIECVNAEDTFLSELKSCEDPEKKKNNWKTLLKHLKLHLRNLII